MFIGSINRECKIFFRHLVEKMPEQDWIIGCSGNFSFEQILTKYAKPGKIFSNDVSLYSCVIGMWLANQTFDCSLKEIQEYDWLRPYMTSQENIIAAIIVLLDVFKYQKQGNLYQQRIYKHYQKNFGNYLEKTADNLKKIKKLIHIDGFYPEDIFKFYNRFKKTNSIFVSFMPTYKGGYESLYKRLDEIFDYAHPEYEILDDQRRDAIYDFLTHRKYIIYDDRELDLPVIFKEKKNRGKTVWLYSNLGSDTGFVQHKRKSAAPQYLMMTKSDIISEKSDIGYLRTDNQAFNYYRELFLSKSIQFSDGQMPILVFIDGRIFGFILFNRAKYLSSDTLYCLSDFVTPHSKYARLSKLILLLMTTTEIKEMVEKVFFCRIKTILTTAFTKKPVSMKYRGVFRKKNRGEGFINYTAEAGTRTTQEALSEWIKRFGKVVKG